MSRLATGRSHATSHDKVVVVGAGLAGLSAAMHLAGAGRHVTVLEAESTPGGSAARLSLPAPDGGIYHLDTGPTVLTMPDLLADCFAALGESLSDWVTLRPLDPAYRAQFADGTALSITSDVDRMAHRIGDFSGAADADGYRRYVEFVTRLYRLQMRDFIDRNFDSPVDLAGSSLAKLVALRGFSRLAPTVARYFRDERLQRIFSFQAMYAGVSPARALAIYAVISYMDLVEGVSYPVGGMNALPTAMEAAARKAGVEFVYDTRVTGATWSGDRVTELRSADGGAWSPGALVMTLDRPAALEVLGRDQEGWRTRRRSTIRYSPSCVVLAAGVREEWPDRAHHTMHFGRAWSRVFDDLDAGRLMRDPSFLVSMPSVTDPGMAPGGRSSAYVLFPAPNLNHDQPLDWARLRDPYREHMLESVENAGYRGFTDAIEAELLITPQDWSDRGLGAGTPFAAAHTFPQTGPFRSHNTVGRNVAFAGASTTPGVGVPMVLISGRLAAERLLGRDPTYHSLAWR
ncbi:MAG: phytoene desaturase family protein [Dermatophilaceae bacterium]